MEYQDLLDDIMLEYPALMVDKIVSKSSLLFYGTIKNGNSFYTISLLCPHFPKLDDMVLKSNQLHQMKKITTNSPNINENWNVRELLQNLPNILSENIIDFGETQPQTETNVFEEIVALYDPAEYKIEMNSNDTYIKFSNFCNNEDHYLELHLPTCQIAKHSLPVCESVNWTDLLQQCTTLTAIVQQFRKYLEDLRPFYENLDDIDELCYVVEPENPTTKHNWRLFLLREHVFIKLSLKDPFAPIACMSVNIVGPTNEVEDLRRTYSAGLTAWDSEMNIVQNFLRIFGLLFFPVAPEANNTTKSDNAINLEEQYCNICYSFRGNDREIPIVSCDNPYCSLVFHPACIRQWLNTLAGGKQFLDVTLGECCCKAKLSTSFAEMIMN